MSRNLTDQQFKKTRQVVGADHNSVGNINDEIIKNRSPLDNVAGEGRSADESIQRQLNTKGRLPANDKLSDEQQDNYEEMKAKLDKRGNPRQE